MVNKVINCYYNKSSSGVGDFLRGCCHLFNTLNEENVDFEFSFQHHDLSEHIKSKCTINVNENEIFDTEDTNKEKCDIHNYFDNMEHNLNECLNSDRDQIFIFSNYSYHILNTEKYFLSEDCKNFMQSNLIFSNDIEKTFNDLDTKDYNVIHFRLGDRECCQHIAKSELDRYNLNTALFDIDYKTLTRKITNYYLSSSPILGEEKTLLVLSDSNDFKHYAEKFFKDTTYNIRIVHTKSQHTSDNPGSIDVLDIDRQIKKDNMYYVVLDMKIISMSNQLRTYSVYPWGSGFSFWLARIFDIPIEQNSV